MSWALLNGARAPSRKRVERSATKRAATPSICAEPEVASCVAATSGPLTSTLHPEGARRFSPPFLEVAEVDEDGCGEQEQPIVETERLDERDAKSDRYR